VVPGSVRLNGQPLEPATRVRVTVNAFMAGGGDSYYVLKEGQDLRTGIMDVDAMEDYVRANPGLKPGPLDRITRLN
jgi:5'-nucleotidase